jgi:hypothetical protein
MQDLGECLIGECATMTAFSEGDACSPGQGDCELDVNEDGEEELM